MPGVGLKELARIGAAARVTELVRELSAIHRAFPELRSGRNNVSNAAGAVVTATRRRRRKPMSAAQRKAVGVRMKKYWLARRRVPR